MSVTFPLKRESWSLSISENVSVRFSNPMVCMSCQCFYSFTQKYHLQEGSPTKSSSISLHSSLFICHPKVLVRDLRTPRSRNCPEPTHGLHWGPLHTQEPGSSPATPPGLRCRYASNQPCDLPSLPRLPGWTLDLLGHLRFCQWRRCSCLHRCHPHLSLLSPCRAARSRCSLTKMLYIWMNDTRGTGSD